MIEFDDSPEVVALKRRIQQLERENHILTFKNGGEQIEYTDARSMPVFRMPALVDMHRIASVRLSRDHNMGCYHMVGSTAPKSSGDEYYSYAYYVSEPELYQTKHRINAFAEMHKRLVFELSNNIGIIKC